jgi:hypothetical protein
MATFCCRLPRSDNQANPIPPDFGPFRTKGMPPMWPQSEDPDFWDDDPQRALDPDQIPFDPDDDEEADPEPGDFYFDDDPADE